MGAATATIWHNPRCGTSRNTLAMLTDAGLEPTVIDYMKTPPSRLDLETLASLLPGGARDLLRSKESLATQLNLVDPAATDDAILDAIVDNPILLNRPLVQTAKGARACRPAETVRELI